MSRDLTVNLFTPTAQGLVPAPGQSTGLFLQDSGKWAAAGGSPASPVNSIQFNNAGAFGGSSNLTWNGTALTVAGTTPGALIQVNGSANASIEIDIENTSAGTSATSILALGDGSSHFAFAEFQGVNSNAQVTGGSAGYALQVGTEGGTHPMYLCTNAIVRQAISGAGNVTINAPSSGIALSTTGFANSFTNFVQASSTSGQSFGIGINAGTTSADAALKINNASNSLILFQVSGDGTIIINPNSTTTAPPAGGGGALPATPFGYFFVTIGSRVSKVPFY